MQKHIDYSFSKTYHKAEELALNKIQNQILSLNSQKLINQYKTPQHNQPISNPLLNPLSITNTSQLMNPSAKASYDKINQYRQKIKQTIISEQGGLTHRQQRTAKQLNDYPKITSSLSRSNIRKNPSDVMNVSRNVEYEAYRGLDDLRTHAPNRVGEGGSRIQERSRVVEDRSRISDKSRIEDKSRVYDNQLQTAKQISEHSRLQILPPKAIEYLKPSSQARTAQKPSTSKSPAKTNPYLQEPETMTKRKNSVKQIQKSTPKPSNPQTYQKTPSFNNLSSFDTFSPRLPLPIPSISTLPPLFNRLNPSSHTAEHQVKILLEQNQILSLHLHQKMQKIKTLERELKAVVKSEILHEEKYDIELSQLNAQKSMLKKSSQEQVKTLVMEVKKLNDELVEKQQEWQERVNMIRKTNLEEQQESKKHHMKMEEKYKAELQEMKIKFMAVNEEYRVSKQESATQIEKLKNELVSITQSTQRIAHVHKMQKSSLSLEHDQQVKTIKQELYTKIELLNLDKMRKQTQLNGIIDSLTKELKKVNNQMEDLKHEKEFSQVKDMQQKGKMMIEIRQEKEKIQRMKQEQNTKLQKISQAELQAMSQGYEHQISQLRLNITNLQQLLQARAQQIANLYKQISQMRKNYQHQLTLKDSHITNLHQKIQSLNQQFLEEQQCFKIKLAEITHANQQTLKDLYENKISEQQHLIMDKEQIISKLREKIAAQCMHASQVNDLHQKQVKEYLTRMEELQQRITANALKEKNTNASMDKENVVLKENLFRQSQSYEKVALVKQESIKRLQKIIETKDTQISELQAKIELMKKSHKQELHMKNEQHMLMIRQKQDIINQIKQQLEYAKRQQSKRAQQFMTDKQYFSNQLRQLKTNKESQFNQCVEKMSSQINQLKIQNQDLRMKLAKTKNQYEQYQKLWNQQESLNKLLAKEKQFMDKMNESFTVKTQKIIEFYEKDINDNYKPKIASLNELIVEKDQQILDMKGNYHQLEMKFQKFMQEKQIYAEISQKVLTLGKSNDGLVKGYVVPGK